MLTLVSDENSMKDPLCNSSFGSMVSLDYVTPDTEDVVVVKGETSRSHEIDEKRFARKTSFFR